MSELATEERAKALKKAFDLLSRRDHSRSELKTKLYSRKFSSASIEHALNECERLGFIDDHNFATRYVAELQFKGYGIFRLREKLYRKGIGKEIIETVLAGIDVDEEKTAARESMEKKLRQLRRETDEQKKQQKLYRYLISRGFSSDTVRELLNEERG
ncbi:MAG: recombination regulator RecX [Victivallaceae bacterium]|nr:recombination regulator RecX [Victivallaceae bacterium]